MSINYSSDAKAAEEALASLPAETKPSAFKADVGSVKECQGLVDKVMAQHGRLDMVLLNAALMPMAGIGNCTEEVFDRIFDVFCRLTVNMSRDKVLARVVHSPADGAAFNASWAKGDPGHLSGTLHQFMGYRPLPNMGYRLPAEGCYLVGPSTHPGSGVTGGARAAAAVILHDLGLTAPATAEESCRRD